MAGRNKPWYARLRDAVETCEQLQDDSDQFALLIKIVIEDTENPLDFLAQCAGYVYDEQKAWIKGWAAEAMTPPPRMRRKVVRAVREHFAQAFKGP